MTDDRIRLRAIHIVAGLHPRHGGPSYSVPRLCTALHGVNVDARIFTVREPGTPQNAFITAFGQDFAGTPIIRELRLSSGLARTMAATVRSTGVIHSHGLWLMPNVVAGRAAAMGGRPLVVSARGMLGLEALAFSAKRKRLFWKWLQGPAYASAAAWHATSSSEADDIRAFGIRAPIAIIVNGIDMPRGEPPVSQREQGPRTILHLGRIHPKKGLSDLVAAWAQLAGERPDWCLHIVGPDEGGHRAELEEMTRRLAAPRVVFGDPVYGVEKGQLLHRADLFALPTRNENFGIAVAEALAAGVPAIVSHGAPWSGLETERCGWWVARGVEVLLETLRAATGLSDEERHAMGARGRTWMARDFGWERVAHDMRAVYQWASGEGERPEFVYVN